MNFRLLKDCAISNHLLFFHRSVTKTSKAVLLDPGQVAGLDRVDHFGRFVGASPHRAQYFPCQSEDLVPVSAGSEKFCRRQTAIPSITLPPNGQSQAICNKGNPIFCCGPTAYRPLATASTATASRTVVTRTAASAATYAAPPRNSVCASPR